MKQTLFVSILFKDGTQRHIHKVLNIKPLLHVVRIEYLENRNIKKILIPRNYIENIAIKTDDMN